MPVSLNHFMTIHMSQCQLLNIRGIPFEEYLIYMFWHLYPDQNCLGILVLLLLYKTYTFL